MVRPFVRFTLFLLVLGLSGCARHAPQPGTLRISGADPSDLDPALAYDTTAMSFVRVLYRGLVDYDAKANIINAIARERHVSPDGLTYTFKIRRDVRYHHTPRTVVAEDFRYEIERVLDPATASGGFTFYRLIDGAQEYSEDKKKPRAQQKIKHVRGIRVQGDDEISFTLTHPDATFLSLLAMPFAYAVPHEAVEKYGKAFTENPDGTGPFMLDKWIHDERFVLKKNPHYYQPELPRCERIEMQIGGDDMLHLMQFEMGDLDIMSMADLTPPDFARLTRDPKWKPYIVSAPMMDIRYVALNTEMKPFNDRRVRQAMNYGVNRERIANFLHGRAHTARGALPPQMPGYNPKLFKYPYDPAKAKQLLRAAGYANGFDVTLWYAPVPEAWYGKAAQSIKQDLSKLNIRVNLKPVTYAELKTAAGKRGNIKMAMMGWLQDFPDPSNFLDVLFNGHKITAEASNNRAFYNNPQVNKLLDAGAREVNWDKRLRLYQQAEKIIVRDAPWIFLHHTDRFVIHQPWVHGFTVHPMWAARYEYVSVGEHS
jgi:ABC-type transport system substrate-binding protein